MINLDQRVGTGNQRVDDLARRITVLRQIKRRTAIFQTNTDIGIAAGSIQHTAGTDQQGRGAGVHRQVVEDIAIVFTLQQITQVNAVAFGGIEVADDVVAQVAMAPDKSIGT